MAAPPGAPGGQSPRKRQEPLPLAKVPPAQFVLLSPVAAGDAARAGTIAAAGAGAVHVQVGDRLLLVPPECQASLVLFKRELAERLQLSGPATLQLCDSAGQRIDSNEDLLAALRERRHPLQAELTVTALREVEQRKVEVENRKEELSHFQWQIVVDQMAALSKEVASVTAQLQAVKDDLRRELQQSSAESALRHDRLAGVVSKETADRERGLHDMDARISTVIQALAVERTDRDVQVHQAKKQAEALASNLEAERSARAQDLAESARQLSGLRQEFEMERTRNAANWNQHVETLRHAELRLERSTSEVAAQQGFVHLNADVEKLRASLRQLEATVAVQGQAARESLQRSSEDLSKAVRNEMVGRENHLTRFAKELEVALQSLEVRMNRVREEAGEGITILTDRARLLEQRCASLERDLSSHTDLQNEKDRMIAQQMDTAVGTVDCVEVGVRASDVVVRSTVSKVEALMERLHAVECDLQLRPRLDFFRPQLEALQRAAERQEVKVSQLEKEVEARFAIEASQRDTAKSQIRTSVRDCLMKFGANTTVAAAAAAQTAPGAWGVETVRVDIANAMQEPLTAEARRSQQVVLTPASSGMLSPSAPISMSCSTMSTMPVTVMGAALVPQVSFVARQSSTGLGYTLSSPRLARVLSPQAPRR